MGSAWAPGSAKQRSTCTRLALSSPSRRVPHIGQSMAAWDANKVQKAHTNEKPMTSLQERRRKASHHVSNFSEWSLPKWSLVNEKWSLVKRKWSLEQL